MPAFNPPIQPKEPPSFIGLSKPISQPSPDTSMATLFKGIGDVLEGAVKGLDYMVKKDIDQTVTDAVSAERDQYIAGLENVIYGANANQDPSTQRTLDVIPPMDASSQQQNVPTPVQDVGRRMSVIQSARESNPLGVAETYYNMRQNQLAKSLRNQYPGYRDYIDQRISGVLGGNPANIYKNSLESLVTKAAGRVDESRKNIREFIEARSGMDSGGLSAPLIMQGWQSGTINEQQVYEWGHKVDSVKKTLEVNKARLENDKLSREHKASLARTSAQQYANTLVLNEMQTRLDMFPKSINEIRSDMIRSTAEGLPADSVQSEQSATMLMGYRQHIITKLVADLNAVGKDGTSIAGNLAKGNDELKEIITEAIFPVDSLIEDLVGKKPNRAASTAAMIEATKNRDIFDALQGPLGARIRKMRVIDSTLPNAVQAGAMALIGGQFQNDLNVYIQSDMIDIFAQQPPKTLNQTVENAQKAGIVDPKYFESITGVVNLINDPSVEDQAKINIAKAAFSPDNYGYVSKFVWDGPRAKIDKGKPIVGQLSVFKQMTNEATTKEMFRLGQSNPGIWEMYIEWAAHSFGQELFNKEIQDLRALQSDRNYRVLWDDENKVLELIPSPRSSAQASKALAEGAIGPGASQLRNAEFLRANETIQRVNSALTNMKPIAEAAGGNIDAYLVELLIQNGVDPTASGTSIPDHILRAILGSGRQKQEEKKKKQEKK